MIKTLYRYWKACIGEELEGLHFEHTTNNVRVFVEELYIKKETPKGYWYSQKGSMKQRWTSKTAKRRYGYPSKDEALTNFIARQKRSIALSKYHVRFSELAIEQATIMQQSANPQQSAQII